MIAPTLRDINLVKVSPSTKATFDKALKITLKNQKEIGAYVCGKRKGNIINFNNATIRTSSNIDRNSFWFNPDSFPSIERSTCRGDDKLVALIHTHPDGNTKPSQRDRLASQKLDMIGCVFGRNGLRCYYDANDIQMKWE